MAAVTPLIRRRARGVLAACALLVAVTPLNSAVPAAAAARDTTGPSTSSAPALILSARDPRGDVRIASGDGPATTLRRSIDLRKLTIEQVGNRIRFTVKIGRVLPVSQDFDQMVLMTIGPRPGSGDDWSGDLGFAVQQPRSAFAYVDQDGTGTDFESCDPLRSTSQASSKTMVLDVPVQCVPSGEAKVRLRTVAGFFRSDAGFFASDSLTVPGVVSLP